MNSLNFDLMNIVVDSSDKCLLFSAEELKQFILQTTGKNLSVQNKTDGKAFYLAVDEEFYKTTKIEDAFKVDFLNGDVLLSGCTPRAVLYAVYDFVEKFLGVKFLSADYIHVEKITALQAPLLSYQSIPDFPVRQFLAKSVEDDLFSARLRLYSENYKIKEEYGGTVKWNGKYGNNHSLLWFTKPAGFFEKGEEKYNYPKYFLNEKGKEHAHVYQLNYKGEAIDICMSDGITDDGEIDESMEISAFKLVLETLKGLIRDTDHKYFPIGQMDHTEECMCEKCVSRAKKFTRAGLNVIFANLLMREIRKWMQEEGIEREIYLVIFAYNYSTLAPVKRENGKIIPLVKADPNICIRIAPIRANCYFPICSNMHFLPYKRIINEWSAVCDKTMFWTYHTQYHGFLWFFPTMHNWSEDLKYFKSVNTEYLFMQSNHCDKVDWKANMELYVASKLLWDVNAGPYEVRNEYIDLFYGVCAPYVKEVLQIFEENYANMADRSEKMRRRIYREVHNEDIEFPDNMPTELICEKLEKEAAAEWTKNVYFSIYGSEIGWYENQPKELLEKQFELLEKAKCEAIKSQEFERLISELEKIELTVRFMILLNYKNYYGEDGYENYKQEFSKLANKTGLKYIAEGMLLENVIDKLKLNYFL